MSSFVFYDIIIVVQCIFPVTYTIGKHERKTVAWSESAKKRMKACCDKVREEKSGDGAPQPTMSRLPAGLLAHRDKLLSGKLSDGDLDDDNALVGD